MSVLSDVDIRKALESSRIVIDPVEDDQIQPASVDLRLGMNFLVPKSEMEIFFPRMPTAFEVMIKPWENNSFRYREFKLLEDDYYVLPPGGFVLAEVLEYVRIGDDLRGTIEGKSSLGRLGLFVHVTAGNIDPGWSGVLTLELLNVSTPSVPFALKRGMKICQISFDELTSPAERVYNSKGLGSKYRGLSVEVSKYHENY